jgi:hypothetical protein
MHLYLSRTSFPASSTSFTNIPSYHYHHHHLLLLHLLRLPILPFCLLFLTCPSPPPTCSRSSYFISSYCFLLIFLLHLLPPLFWSFSYTYVSISPPSYCSTFLSFLSSSSTTSTTTSPSSPIALFFCLFLLLFSFAFSYSFFCYFYFSFSFMYFLYFEVCFFFFCTLFAPIHSPSTRLQT